MKHFQLQGAALLRRTALVSMCVVFAAQAAPCFSTQGALPQQSAAAAKRQAQSKQQKVTNPLNELLDEAQRDIDANNFEAAVPPLQKFIGEKPEVAFAHFQLGYAYTALKRGEEARAEYERAISLDPKMPEAYLNLGILLLDKHEYAAAVAPLSKAVELLPAQSRPRSLLAVAQDRSGDQEGAARSFEGVLHLDPNDLAANHYLGELDLRTKKPAQAEMRFRHALEIRPDAPEALQGLARSLEAQNKPEAADAYRKYLAAMPGDSGARGRLIRLLVNAQEYDAALAELDVADAGKPASLDSLRLRADIQIAEKKLADAIVTLQQAITLAPRDAQLIGGLGRVYLQKRDFASAEKELKAALQIDNNNFVYWKDLSSTYYLSGNCPATLATLDVIAKAEPPASGAWFIRALCYDKLHQFKAALEAYEKFLAMEQGKTSDQVWQAQQRSSVLKHMLEGKR
ncbi:MAG TPA: tetratricopeptide repeat protein [Candidatus Acidoferrum sp.]|nr:tetratricopeptide repeat protein [Candidatus Acidoferrum sp.]